jgi:hypothetical protein
MMPSAGHQTGLFIGSVELSTDGFSLGVSIDTPQEDATTFQGAGAKFVSLSPAYAIDMAGYYSGGAVRSLEERINYSLTATPIVCALFGTNVPACPAYLIPFASANDMKISAGQKLLTMNGKWGTNNGGMKRGLRILQGRVATAGAQATVDMGSAGSNGGAVYVLVYGVGGTASGGQITVQSAAASNFASPSTLVTVAVNGTSTGGDLVSGAIGRYLRANVVSLGGASYLDILVIACVNNVTM